MKVEGWRHGETESINRSKGEIREMQHHLDMAQAKNYLTKPEWSSLDYTYETCDKMLERLYQRLSEWRGSTRNPNAIHEDSGAYGRSNIFAGWESIIEITCEVMTEFENNPMPHETSS